MRNHATRFQIGIITGSSSILRPEEPGTVLEVDEDTGGLLVQFDS
jgi:hypothetical protein